MGKHVKEKKKSILYAECKGTSTKSHCTNNWVVEPTSLTDPWIPLTILHGWLRSKGCHITGNASSQHAQRHLPLDHCPHHNTEDP